MNSNIVMNESWQKIIVIDICGIGRCLFTNCFIPQQIAKTCLYPTKDNFVL